MYSCLLQSALYTAVSYCRHYVQLSLTVGTMYSCLLQSALCTAVSYSRHYVQLSRTVDFATMKYHHLKRAIHQCLNAT